MLYTHVYSKWTSVAAPLAYPRFPVTSSSHRKCITKPTAISTKHFSPYDHHAVTPGTCAVVFSQLHLSPT